MKLTRLRPVGRYEIMDRDEKKIVNIHKGIMRNGRDAYFYYYRNKRILIGEAFINWKPIV